MKKILFTFVFLLASIAACAAYDVMIDGIYYNINPQKRIAIVTKGDVNYKGDITIPSTIVYNGEDYTVTEITEEAFRDCMNVVSLTIPYSVTKIADNAFWGCVSLRKLVLPDHMEKLPEGMCVFCSQLTDVTLPSHLRTITKAAFSQCTSLSSITLPEDLLEIESQAFLGCTSLTSIVIPPYVGTLWEGAFKGCTNLVSARLSDNLKNIPNSCFASCLKLSEIDLPEGIGVIGKDAFANCESLTHLTIPNSVPYIENGAFAGSGITIVDIPPSVTRIEDHSFEGCPQLQTVIISKNTWNIGFRAFYNNQNLKDVYIYSEEPPSSCDLYAFESSNIRLATLHVPASAIEGYRSTPPWSKFGSIVPIETGIEDVKVSNFSNNSPYYNLNGIRVAQPRKGVYIKDGKVVVIK